VVRALGKWNPRFISSLNKAKETPLHWAAAKGKTPMVKLLLEMGAWRLCDSQSDEGWTPLHHAAANGHFHTVEVLVQRGTKINTQNNKGNTPLHIASSNGQAGIVDFLVKKGARSDIMNNEGRTAAGSGKSAAVNNIMEPEGGGGGAGGAAGGRPGGGAKTGRGPKGEVALAGGKEAASPGESPVLAQRPSQAEQMDDSSDDEDGGDSLQERLKKEAMKQASAQKVLNPKGARRRSMHQVFLNKYGLDQ